MKDNLLAMFCSLLDASADDASTGDGEVNFRNAGMLTNIPNRREVLALPRAESTRIWSCIEDIRLSKDSKAFLNALYQSDLIPTTVFEAAMDAMDLSGSQCIEPAEVLTALHVTIIKYIPDFDAFDALQLLCYKQDEETLLH